MGTTIQHAMGMAALLTAAAGAPGATVYWTGDVDNFWSTGGAGPAANTNWSTSSSSNIDYGKAPGSITGFANPGGSDDLVFYSTGAGNLSTMIMSAASGHIYINSITMSGANTVTIGADNTNQFLDVGAGGVTIDSGAGQLAWEARTSISVDQEWANNSANELRVYRRSITTHGNAKLTMTAGTMSIYGTSGPTVQGGLVGQFQFNSGAKLKRDGGAMSTATVILEGGSLDGNGTGAIIGHLGGSGGTFDNFTASGDLSLDLSAGGTSTYSGNLSGFRNFALRGNNAPNANGGTQVFTGTASYTGTTSIASIGGKSVTLQLAGGNNRLPTGTNVVMGLAATSATTARLILGDAAGAINQTVAGLSSFNDPDLTALVVGGNANVSTLTVNNASGANKDFYGALGGTGTNENNLALTKSNTGTLTLYGVNTYAGDTTVSGGTLALADNAGLRFVIGANGVNNKITGTGTLNLNGDFTFDLTNAVAASGNSWNIVAVNTLGETFNSSFSVVDFDDSDLDNIWTRTVGSAIYEFSESTGILSVTVPEPSSLGALALAAGMLLRRRRA